MITRKEILKRNIHYVYQRHATRRLGVYVDGMGGLVTMYVHYGVSEKYFCFIAIIYV